MAKGNVLDKAGFQVTGYIDKKGSPYAIGATIDPILNKMPPGQEIDDQVTADIRAQPYKEMISAAGYPGDGWQGSSANPMTADIGPNIAKGGRAKERG